MSRSWAETRHPVGLALVVGEDGLGLGQVCLLVQEVRLGAFQVGAGHLETRLGAGQRRLLLVQGMLHLGGLDHDQELAGLHQVTPLGADLPDVARGLGEEARLAVGQDVPGIGEGDVEVPPLGGRDSDHDFAGGSADGAGLLLAETQHDEEYDHDQEGEEHDRHAVAADEGHRFASPAAWRSPWR